MYPTSYLCIECLRMFVCVPVCVAMLYVGLCVLVSAWCLSGRLCLIWLMEVVVEAALPWLKLQAALGFSLTYDNAPVTLIRNPRSAFVADGCSRFFFAFFFFGLLSPDFPPCSIYLLLFSLFSPNFFCTPRTLIQTQIVNSAVWRVLLTPCQSWP